MLIFYLFQEILGVLCIAPPATPVPPPLHQMVILVMFLLFLIVTMILHKLKQIQFEIHYALRPLF